MNRKVFTKKIRSFISNPKASLISKKRKVSGHELHVIEIGQATGILKQPIEHAIDHAKFIAMEALKSNLPIKLFLSGGVDSEAMAEAFLLANVNFEVVIGRYNEDMNFFDYKDAVAFCEKHNLKVQFIDVDVFEFLENGGALKYAQELNCRSPQIAVHLHLFDQVSGYCVLAGNPIFPVFRHSLDEMPEKIKSRNLAIGDVWGAPNQTQSVYLRFFEKRNRQGQPFFVQSSPELCMSFLNLDEIVDSMAAGIEEHDYKMKCQMYNLGGFKVSPRKNKYTGFEKYRIEYDKQMNTSWGTGFDTCFRRPLEEIDPLLPLKVSFVLPAQIAEKLLKKIDSRIGRGLASSGPVSHLSRRQLLWQAGAVSGGFIVSLLMSRFAQAASCQCCSGGVAVTNQGVMLAATCDKLCAGLGYTEVSIGGGTCE